MMGDPTPWSLSGHNLEFTGVVAARSAGYLLHIMSLPGCPEQTLLDQPLGDKTNRGRVAVTVCGGRSMVDEEQIEIQGVDRDVAGLCTEQTGQHLQCGLPSCIQRKSPDYGSLRFARECCVIQKVMPQPLTDAQENAAGAA